MILPHDLVESPATVFSVQRDSHMYSLLYLAKGTDRVVI
jgi:hypothetical protein